MVQRCADQERQGITVHVQPCPLTAEPAHVFPVRVVKGEGPRPAAAAALFNTYTHMTTQRRDRFHSPLRDVEWRQNHIVCHERK